MLGVRNGVPNSGRSGLLSRDRRYCLSDTLPEGSLSCDRANSGCSSFSAHLRETVPKGSTTKSGPFLGNGPNTVSESTVSNTGLSEFFGPRRVPRRELSEFCWAYDLCAKANSPSFPQNSPSLPQNSVSSLFRNSTLETVFRPFSQGPNCGARFSCRLCPPFPKGNLPLSGTAKRPASKKSYYFYSISCMNPLLSPTGNVGSKGDAKWWTSIRCMFDSL